jgi:Arc/MetJ-type ribon-helix-helix transcriptional regulator
MEIHLPPDLAAEIQHDVDRGPYRTVDEFVLHAVALLHDQEKWLAANREVISERIEAGWASAQLGHLAGEDEARRRMDKRKRIWLDQHRTA